MAEQPVVSFMDKMQALTTDPAAPQPRPAYTIEPMTRKTLVNKAVKDDMGFRIIPTEVTYEGYMLRTFRGDSVFLKHDDLVRLKLDKNLIPMVMPGGDDTPVGMVKNNALSDKQRTTLDILTQMLERDPQLLERLMAMSQTDETEEKVE